jgi:fermentation-respiration switch protein FrsA (DUF1100 family)
MAIGLFAWQRDLLYHPFGHSAPPRAVGVPEMSVLQIETADGLTIHGWYAPPSRPGAPTVVLYQGNTGTTAMRAFKARVLLDAGLGVWLAGYRGFDGNPGFPSEDGLYSDARAVLDWLARNGTPAGRVVLYGESLGTGVAVQIATERDVAAVVLESPYTSVPDIAELRYPLMPVQWLALDRFDSIAKVGRIRAPLLITHGDQDTVVPVMFAHQLFEKAPGPKEAVFLPRAGHLDMYAWGVGKVILGFIHRYAEQPEALVQK